MFTHLEIRYIFPPRSAACQIDLAPRLQTLLRTRMHYQCNTWLGMFGGATPKPVKLYSDDEFVTHLYRALNYKLYRGWRVFLVNHVFLASWSARRKLQRGKFQKSDTTVQYRNKAGERKFKGSSTLKSTQTYPRRFGTSVTWQFVKWMYSPR